MIAIELNEGKNKTKGNISTTIKALYDAFRTSSIDICQVYLYIIFKCLVITLLNKGKSIQEHNKQRIFNVLMPSTITNFFLWPSHGFDLIEKEYSTNKNYFFFSKINILISCPCRFVVYIVVITVSSFILSLCSTNTWFLI